MNMLVKFLTAPIFMSRLGNKEFECKVKKFSYFPLTAFWDCYSLQVFVTWAWGTVVNPSYSNEKTYYYKYSRKIRHTFKIAHNYFY